MVGLLLVPAPSAAGQAEVRCCGAELKVEPTWTIENLRRGRVEIDGVVEQTPPESCSS